MSRMKINFLTQMGRQVSEDPDLDTLLSTLSPEEMEELQEDMMKAPEVNPEAGQSRPDQPSTSNNINNTARDAKVDSRKEGDLRGRLRQREQSQEQSDTKKESRKQEYLRKMGLSQEGNEDRRSSLRRQPSEQSERDVKSDERNSKGPEGLKEERSRLSGRYRTQESRESEANEKESFSDNKLRRDRESTGSKAKDMISKLQDKRDNKEKDNREDFRRRDESKTKDIISKLREKSEKDAGKERERKSENFRTQGLVSKMLEKQNKVVESQESKTEERKTKVEEKKVEEKKKMDVKLERQTSVKGEVKVKPDKAEKESEDLVNHSDHVKEKDKSEKTEKKPEDKKEDFRGKVKTDVTKTDKADEKTGNCVAKDSQTKEEENDDEDSSMFDELMEQVRSNDPSLTELNVNNSEVIKIKTLIEFAEALRNNTHIKTFALANCRADDHVAYAIAGMLRNNKTITSLNVDSNHLTGKGILSLIQALQYNSTLTELRFQNQRHICGGKTEMEMSKILKDNTTLLKLGYHFELAGPRMTTTNILSRNMDRQRQKRLQEQKQAQANGDKKETLDVPKTGGGGSLRNSPKASPKPSPIPSPMPSPKLTPKRRTGGPTPPPPPPPPGGTPPPPPPPMFDIDSLKNTLTPVSQRKLDGKGPGGSKNSRDQLLASIRKSNINQLKKVPVPKWLQ